MRCEINSMILKQKDHPGWVTYPYTGGGNVD